MAVVMAANVVGIPCVVLNLLPPWRTAGVFAVGNGAAAVDEIVQGQHLMLAFNGSVCVVCAWQWWNGGVATARSVVCVRWPRRSVVCGVPRR